MKAQVHPGEGAAVQLWILGSSGGASAEVAGRNALRFAANYHVSPATILEAVEGYRAAFVPGAELSRPYVCVSVDAVVAETDECARELAEGYGLWVLGIRSGEGADPFPSPEEARAHRWTEEERALVERPGRAPRWSARRRRSWSSSAGSSTSPAPTRSSSRR